MSSGWTKERTPNPPGRLAVRLSGIACTSVRNCVAVGGGAFGNPYPYPIAERREGTTWSLETVEVPPGATTSSFSGVACPAKHSCIGVGDSLHADRTVTSL